MTKASIHSAQRGSIYPAHTTGVPALLDHLTSIDFEPEVLDAPDEGFVPLKKLSAPNILEGQVKTADWLKELGASDDEEITTEAQTAAARDAFAAVTTGSPDAKTALLNLKAPLQRPCQMRCSKFN